MPGFFSKLKGKDGPTKTSKSKKNAQAAELPSSKPVWVDAWLRKSVEPEEIQELLHGCTMELKSRGLDMPFLLLPFRPTSDPSAARTFVRNFFERANAMHGDFLRQELRLTEPMVLCSVVKWCWSRLPGGVVSWDAYELFRVGEQDSNQARDSFSTFIPLSVESDARTRIIFDFFDLLAAIAAHGKTNGLGGRKLSRLAGWWAFEHSDNGKGFEGGYRTWTSAADATSHLFFAYLRSQSPDSVKGLNGISTLPMSLQKLVQETEYPPQHTAAMQIPTTRVVMIVGTVSPTPFALLRRANHFEYRDDDRALQQFSDYEDPVQALTEECRRVLKSISSANQSEAPTTKQSTGLTNASWSRFEDLGFSGAFDEADEDEDDDSNFMKRRRPEGLRSTARSGNLVGGRPTTPSWADFLSSGFVDEARNGPAPLLLPPDKILPPIDTSGRGRTSQSHRPRPTERDLDPGELANITRFNLDEAFWWVWISSLAGEELPERKAAFGRCALVETIIPGGKWLVLEEMVKGAASEPVGGAYVAEKKTRFWTRRKGSARRKSTGKRDLEAAGLQTPYNGTHSVGVSKTSIGPDQHARIQAAAARLQQKQRQQEEEQNVTLKGRNDTDLRSQRTNSVFTLQPVIMSEASPAMKWANKYDKDAIKEAYLANNAAGRGLGLPPSQSEPAMNFSSYRNDELTPAASMLHRNPSSTERDLPTIPSEIQESGPAVPSKSITPPPAPFPPTPAADEIHHEQVLMSDKAAEVALPNDTHPVERNPEASLEQPRAVTPEPVPIFQTTTTSPKDKKHKLQKKSAGVNTGGFKKLFGRKNRQSKLPENAAEILNGNQVPKVEGQLQPGGATIGRRFSGFRKKTPQASPNEEVTPVYPVAPEQVELPAERYPTPAATPEPPAMSYEPSLVEDGSRIDTAEAHEANQAFSTFDQGPLDDMPAFVPSTPTMPGAMPEDEPEEVAAPPPPSPPVIRKQIPSPAAAPVQAPAPPAPVAALAQAQLPSQRTPPPMQAPPQKQAPAQNRFPIRTPGAAPIPSRANLKPVPKAPAAAPAPPSPDVAVNPQDRWAQIRKNAAERAAKREPAEEQAAPGNRVSESTASVATENDSGEETIESRVARIKARVAELTGNMETSTSGPAQPSRHGGRW